MPEDTTNVGQIALIVVLALVLLFVVIALFRSVRIVPQTVAVIVERIVPSVESLILAAEAAN